MVRKPPRGVKIGLVCLSVGRYNCSMDKSVRRPIVAGAFYPANPDRLHASIASFFEDGIPPSSDRPLNGPAGLIAPHAGYPYSGAVAAAGYAAIAEAGRPETVVLLGANHTGLGGPVSISSHEAWETPIGRSPVSRAVIGRLADAGFAIADDAFEREHSIEVQLPLIQTIWDPEIPIVPICVMSAPWRTLRRDAEAIEDATAGMPTLIVASSDFTHYETDATARTLDRQALEPILKMEIDAFEALYRDRRLSICGAGAIMMLLHLCRRRGILRGNLLRYATSADATGDRSAVVGYASVRFMMEAT